MAFTVFTVRLSACLLSIGARDHQFLFSPTEESGEVAVARKLSIVLGSTKLLPFEHCMVLGWPLEITAHQWHYKAFVET